MAEYYPRQRDPAGGVWAHRQAVAAREAGAELSVLALERPMPSAAAMRGAAHADLSAARAELRALARQPRRDTIDGIEIEYVRFFSPPRASSYGSWHRSAQRPLGRALDRLHAQRPLDLVHAHYALPAGGAAAPWAARNGVPLAVSVHGGDLLSPLLATPAARAATAIVLKSARVTIANSRGMLELAAALAGSADRMRVIHPPGEPPPRPLPPKRERPTIATLGAVDPRKRHEDVLAALARLPEEVRGLVIGDGPERERLESEAASRGLADRIEWTGALPPREAVAALAGCHVMAMPSVDEAFGVAYTEALACGLPAIGCAGEPGPQEIAALTDAMLLVPPRDPAALASAVEDALAWHEGFGAAAARAAADHFSLEVCGRETVAAYGEAL